MSKKTAFWVFLLGTLSSAAIFLALTWDFHRQVGALTHEERLSARVVAGKRAFERRNCNDCHTILGFGGYYAPDLTRVVRRVGKEGIRYRLADPGKAFSASWRKMPRQRLSGAEIEDMAAFLEWVGGVENNDWPPQDSATLAGAAKTTAGEGVLRGKPCLGCHSLHGAGGTFGPPFDGLGLRLTREQIENYVRNPQGVNPKALMPAQSTLSDEDLDQIATFIAGLK